jgi:hypothetical protein
VLDYTLSLLISHGSPIFDPPPPPLPSQCVPSTQVGSSVKWVPRRPRPWPKPPLPFAATYGLTPENSGESARHCVGQSSLSCSMGTPFLTLCPLPLRRVLFHFVPVLMIRALKKGLTDDYQPPNSYHYYRVGRRTTVGTTVPLFRRSPGTVQTSHLGPYLPQQSQLRYRLPPLTPSWCRHFTLSPFLRMFVGY